MTKREFLDWKTNKITQEILAQFRERVFLIQETLSRSAGVNPLEDRFRVGYIAAFNDIINIEPEEEDL